MLKVINLHKVYKQPASHLHVLKGIDLTIESSEVVAVVGPSGAGKSTLLHIIGGLDRPSDGSVFIDGQDLYQMKDHLRAQVRNIKIGFIFQFYHLLPEFSALENVMLPALVKPGSDLKEVKGRSLDLLRQVGLEQRQSHMPNELSGGEQQRVAIARALMNNPGMLLCDEPTGNLDSQTGGAIIDLLMELNQKNKLTIIIVTHDEQIARRCQRTLHMQDGSINQIVSQTA